MTIKEVKSYLLQYRVAVMRAKAAMVHRDELRDIIERASPNYKDPIPKHQNTGDKLGAAIADVEAAEDCVSDELEMLAATEREITNTINSVEDGTLSVLLYERYINSKTWEQIAVILNYSYVHVVHRLHPLALRAVQMMSEKS